MLELSLFLVRLVVELRRLLWLVAIIIELAYITNSWHKRKDNWTMLLL